MDAYFILRVRIQIQFLNSVLKLFGLWLLGALSIAALPFRFTPNHCSFFFFFLNHFLTSWHYKRLQVHLVYFLPRFWNQPSPSTPPPPRPGKEPWLLLLENCIRNERLGTRFIFTYVHIVYMLYSSNSSVKLLVLFYSWAIFAALHRFPWLVIEPGLRFQILFD